MTRDRVGRTSEGSSLGLDTVEILGPLRSKPNRETGAFEFWSGVNLGSAPTLANDLPPAAAKAGRRTLPRVFARETLLGDREPFHTFFHGGSAGRDVAD